MARTVVWLFILGAGLRGSVRVPGHISYLAFVFPGMMAMAIIFSSLQSAISVIFDREFGFLKEVLVAPIPRSSIIVGQGPGRGHRLHRAGLAHLPLRADRGRGAAAAGLAGGGRGDAADRPGDHRRWGCCSRRG